MLGIAELKAVYCEIYITSKKSNCEKTWPLQPEPPQLQEYIRRIVCVSSDQKYRKISVTWCSFPGKNRTFKSEKSSSNSLQCLVLCAFWQKNKPSSMDFTWQSVFIDFSSLHQCQCQLAMETKLKLFKVEKNRERKIEV